MHIAHRHAYRISYIYIYIYMYIWVCPGNHPARRVSKTLLRSYTFRIRSPHKMKDFAGKLYVPIRSVQPSRDSCVVSRASHSCPNVAILFPFLYVPLYVPIRSCTFHELRRIVLHQPWSARPVEICYRPHRKKQNTINSYTFLYVPRHPSCICCKM